MVDFYVDGAANTPTLGYDLHFDNTDFDFTDNFRLDGMVGIAPKLGMTETSVTGGDVSGTIVPANQFIATVTLTALRDIPSDRIPSTSAPPRLLSPTNTSVDLSQPTTRWLRLISDHSSTASPSLGRRSRTTYLF
jgi:hypothetical protein